MSDETPPLPRPKAPLTRRHFLKAAASLPVLGAAGCSSPSTAKGGLSTSTSSSPDDSTSQVGSPSLDGFNAQPVEVLEDKKTAPGYIFVTPAPTKGFQHGVTILDNDGQMVWFHPLVGSLEATNLQVQRYKGEPVLTWWVGHNVLPGYGQGHYVIADTSYNTIKHVYAGNGLIGDLHEFVITPRDTALLTAYDTEPLNLKPVGGAREGTLLNAYFQELDIATGKVLFQWQAYPHVSLEASYDPAPKKAHQKWDFFHINSIDIDTDGNYLISSRHTWAVYKINASSGDIMWKLNGKHSDFKMGPKAEFAWQHHARHHGQDLITLFDDGAGVSDFEKESRGLTLRLDLQKMTADMVEEYLPQPSFLADSQGSMQVLPNGNVFIGWGSVPYFSEYTADAALLYNAHLPPRSHSYRAFRFPWVGRPTTDPVIAVSRSGKTVSVSACWNGATEVKSWQVLGGADASSLAVLGSFLVKGFETTMTLSTKDKSFAVVALDAAGKVIGRSKTVSS